MAGPGEPAGRRVGGYPGSRTPSELLPPQLRPGARRRAGQRLRAQRARDGFGRCGARPRPRGPGVVPLQPPAAAESAQVAAPPPRPCLRPHLHSARPAPPAPAPALPRPSARCPLPSAPSPPLLGLAARLGEGTLPSRLPSPSPPVPTPPSRPLPGPTPGLNRGLVAAQDGRAACGTLRGRGPGPRGSLWRRSPASTTARTSSAGSPSALRRSPAPSAGSTW